MVYEDISDLNILKESFEKAYKCCKWKAPAQKFKMNEISELTKLSNELKNKTYKVTKCKEFKLNERGRQRFIFNVDIRDRVVRHALCDYIIQPNIEPYLIYNNSASRKGKGLSFAREQFEEDLHNFYLENHSNEGYVGFIDFSKFYDNIRHDKIKEYLYPKIPSEYHWLLDVILESFEVDVSYMTDEEFDDCLNWKYDQIEYHNLVTNDMKTGQKMMKKSVGIGDQISQNIGIFFPTKIDNYTKIVRSQKRYGRYMDDMYIICKDKQELISIIEGIKERAKEIGLFVNPKKTRISKLSKTFKFLQIKYFLTDKGKVVKRINPQTLTRERIRLKAYKKLLDKGQLAYEDIRNAYKSWMGNFAKLMSKKQIENIKELYIKLFNEDLKWKKP